MAVIRCKMCGGDLVLVEGQSVAECEYCGSKQTVPAADNEKKLNLFTSANKLRAACEFDRAAGIYDAIKAEFPSEAEAYWGLVLCKYGIEYVDDPASGRKIPTCHRLSYDSVMEDVNLELAMDNADAVARKVYREEARQLEKIREGILAVSSNEKPYDIFICYKETDPNGDRTLDSVLAQDLYTALTDKGYRVFFSRITLQSKLGEAYEPYIFAALNSAKVMLAIGTDPEYYNAVWVKNEWSRYLKICAADKNKHLIPCYKGLDAYDMPREFRPLQGVDLGKMGAVQDILFNMEKYIPLKKQNTTVIQEKVVVGGTGGSNKIASLLDRGNMALEDGNWAKADSFFEDVLNNDSRNAQAYIGKALAMEKCRTLDALKRKRLESYPTPKAETLYIPERTSHVEEMVAQYSLPGYMEEATVRALYKFDRGYDSLVSGRQQQYHEEELWWENHRQLSRAVKFASGPVAENLKAEKQHLLSQLADRVKKAQEADARSVAKLEAAYDAHVAQADAKVEQKYADALARREKDYDYWLGVAKATETIEQLRLALNFFDHWKTYKDSKNLAEHCRKRIADITAEQKRKEAERKAAAEAEAERRRIAEEKAAAARKKRNRRKLVISLIFTILFVSASVYAYITFVPTEAAFAVEDGITKLSQEELALHHIDDIQNLEEMYSELIEKDKKAVSNYEMLVAIRANYDAMETAEIKRLEELISTLPKPEDIRLDSEDLIEDIEWEYKKATEVVQQKVSNSDILNQVCTRLENYKAECWNKCTVCGGDGSVTCSLCKGKGSRIVNHTTPNGKTWQVSQECRTTESCSACSGRGGVYVEEPIVVPDAPLSAAESEKIYMDALVYLDKGDYENAYKQFVEIPEYQDVPEYLDDFYLLPISVSVPVFSTPTNYEYYYDDGGKLIGGKLLSDLSVDRKGRLVNKCDNGIDYDFTYLSDGTIKEIESYHKTVEAIYDEYGNVLERYRYEKVYKSYWDVEYDEHHNPLTGAVNHYDANGNLMSVEWKDGRTVLFTYQYLYRPEGGFDAAIVERNWINLRLLMGLTIWHLY